MQTENCNCNLCQKYIVLWKRKTVTETCLKINCIMQTENSYRNLSKKTHLKHILYYAN